MALPNLRRIFSSSRTSEQERALSRQAFFRFATFVASCITIALLSTPRRRIPAALLPDPRRSHKMTQAGSTFAFPQIYSFPPFFTQQSHPETQQAQLAQWVDLISSYCREKRVFFLDCAPGSSDLRSELFTNAQIERSVNPTFAAALLSHMVATGAARWERDLDSKKANKTSAPPPQGSQRAIIFWRRPEEWAELIYDWIKETGQNKSILTFYELVDGDLAQSTDFRELPLPLLRLALAHLAKTGRAQVFTGEEGLTGGEGVKFV